MCGGSAEVRVQVRLQSAGRVADAGAHGRDCVCGGRLTPEECTARVSAIWTLINQRAELSRQLAGRSRAVAPAAGSRAAWRSALALARR